jgi:branched-subunit amino acid aminotransferase/4-amino-4-deoxychorismate lyase
VTPVCEITRGEQVIKIGENDGCGPVLQKLYEKVQAIQYGELPDLYNWCWEVPNQRVD